MGKFKANNAPSTHTSQARGIALVAGQRIPAIKTSATAIGKKATSANKTNDMENSFGEEFEMNEQHPTPACCRERCTRCPWNNRRKPGISAGKPGQVAVSPKLFVSDDWPVPVLFLPEKPRWENYGRKKPPTHPRGCP